MIGPGTVDGMQFGVGDEVGDAVGVPVKGGEETGPGGQKNCQVPELPASDSPAANRAIRAASFDETAPLPLTSAVKVWLLLTNGIVPATACAIRAASFELMAGFAPPALAVRKVYMPGPKPVSVYVPDDPVETGPTTGDPDAMIETFWTGRGGAGLPIAFPYVIIPLTDGVFIGVAVLVAVLVGVLVAVAVFVGVFVAVFVGVFVGVRVGVAVAVLVGVLVAVAVFVGVFVGVAAGGKSSVIVVAAAAPLRYGRP